MYDLMVVHEALRKSFEHDSNLVSMEDEPDEGEDKIVSQLIHDVFGGEILKTSWKRGWHFYNRVDGLRLDFTRLGFNKKRKVKRFEDILSSPGEIQSYFAIEDYSNFFMRFVKAFEEAVGLNVRPEAG